MAKRADSSPLNLSSLSLASFCKALRKPQRFLLACHIMPEGDALGSLYAMQSLLKRLGKKVWMAGEEPLPESFHPIFDPKIWKTGDQIRRQRLKFDALLVTDCATYARVGKIRELISAETKIFNIDHHVSNEGFGHFNYVRPKAAASGEAVYEIFKHFRKPLTRAEAHHLYVALATDTGSFRFSNTGSQTHRLAAEFIEKGIDVESISRDIYANYSLNKIYLYSHLLRNVKTEKNSRIAWVAMSRKDVKRYGANYQDSEGFIDFLRLIQSVEVAFFASELPEENAVRISFRATGKRDVQKIASYFGGGGHRKSSGCLFPGMSLKEAVSRVLRKIKKEMRS